MNAGETRTLYYFYDEKGDVAGFEYNGNAYFYQKNIQGDVLRLCDEGGLIFAEYTYDAWGKVLSVTDAKGNAITSETHIANLNPFRYRSYYYDTETGFYYLNSRYYDPEITNYVCQINDSFEKKKYDEGPHFVHIELLKTDLE